ncbi:adenylate/guanylate cyclase domain-containing protein [Undibacterium sp. CY18W]|uniref:Adenylate/guanylate cyclase domain-containing protein n=1 Tax=Undibacterium hunanense TaxID=2762292 RepID=A0ABR6ZT94_9BURK|nr:adenylate/guanylate cyclase domain-containing protein [Undibacterium hunanense]MBC3918773.1 adenylate/guanylate cyclase domain-containing protein [Undibacterium hunanense]
MTSRPVSTRFRPGPGWWVPVLLCGFAALLLNWSGTQAMDNKLLDIQFWLAREYSPQTVEHEPVIVGINEAFLDEVDEPLVLNHVYLAEFLKTMNLAGARAVGMDVSLPEKRYDTLASTRKTDADFHKALLSGILETIQGTPVVAAKVWDMQRRHFINIQVDYAAVLGMQNARFQPLASAEFCRDSDQRIRRFPGKHCQPDGGASGLATEVAAAAGVRQDWSGLINYRLGPRFDYIPLQDVLQLSDKGNIGELKRRFEGRVVLLGATMEATDLVDLPVPLASWLPDGVPNPGVLAHAQLLRSIMNQRMLKPASNEVLFTLCCVFVLFWFGRSVRWKVALFVLAVTSLLAASTVAMQYDVWLPPTAILLTGLLALGSSSAYQGWRHFIDKQRLSKAFSGRVSPAVMDEIVAGREHNYTHSRRLPVCVLFSDIRGFTTLCEHAQAEEVVSLLNRYFAVMSKAVHEHGGTIDKFIGDGMMAFFGAPNALPSPEQSAFDAARDMLYALADLNTELQQEGKPPLAIGIGLHSGDAVIGQVGSAERHEYTAIGDTVNTAARIEGLCKDVGYPVVCSDTVADKLLDLVTFVSLGEKQLKGRSAMAVFGWQLPQETTTNLLKKQANP